MGRSLARNADIGADIAMTASLVWPRRPTQSPAADIENFPILPDLADMRNRRKPICAQSHFLGSGTDTRPAAQIGSPQLMMS